MREGEAVAGLLGLEPDEHRSLGLPDQGALDHLPQIAAALEEMLAGVTDLYVCAYEGGHPDHDAVNLVAARTAARGGRVHEFSLYRRGPRGLAVKARFPGEPGPPERFLLDRPALELRRRLATANASQLPELAILWCAAALGARLAVEPVRGLPAHDYEHPPFGRRPLYELYTRCRYEQFREAARRGW
jgi:LmbE family N-acetylglucosaminyl deacetylase